MNTTDVFEFQFIFNSGDEPYYILHDNDHFDATMLHMLVEFGLAIEDIKEWRITSLKN